MRPTAPLRATFRFGVTILVFGSGKLLAQCSMCWSALVHSAEGETLVRGFNSGILFLLAAPFLVVGAVAFLVYNARRGLAPRAWSEQMSPSTSPGTSPEPDARTWAQSRERAAETPAPL